MSVYEEPIFLSSGESCLVAEFADEIDRGANIRLQALRRSIESRKLHGVRELVATYRSLAIHFDPLILEYSDIERIAQSAMRDTKESKASGERIVALPVLYGGEYGPDMENVAAHTGLSAEEVIKRHTGRDCYCFMLGFMPGFPYLGGMDESIAAPRLKEPRTLIPAGSIGIADKQTGGYPFDSPGGWQLIGRTPAKLYDPRKKNPFLLEAGDWVRFRSIGSEEYAKIAALETAGHYAPEVISK